MSYYVRLTNEPFPLVRLSSQINTMATTQTPRRVLTDVMIRAGLSDIKRSPDTLRHSYTTLHLEVCDYVFRDQFFSAVFDHCLLVRVCRI
jgi:integrase